MTKPKLQPRNHKSKRNEGRGQCACGTYTTNYKSSDWICDRCELLDKQFNKQSLTRTTLNHNPRNADMRPSNDWFNTTGSARKMLHL